MPRPTPHLQAHMDEVTAALAEAALRMADTNDEGEQGAIREEVQRYKVRKRATLFSSMGGEWMCRCRAATAVARG